MRRTLVSAGSPPPPTSPMSASAPETGRIGATYSAHNQRPHGIARASSNISNAHRNSTEKYGKRSRSALGLSSRSNSVSSSHSHHTGEAPTSDPYAHQPHHPGYDAHPPRPSSTRSSSSTAETPKSTTSSTLSVHDDDVLSSMSITLSPERRQMLVDFVDRSVDDAYNLCHGFGSIRWLPSKIREGVSIYRAKSGELSDDPRLDASVRGKCNVSASFDEMLDTLITETTSDFVGHESTVNPGEFLDGQVLCVLVPRTRADRYVCVKWHCIKSHAPSVAKHRDYVYVEVVDTFTDRDGRKVGFRLSKSIDIEELNAYDHSAIFVRGKTLTLHTFSQVSPGNLELYTMMINDLGERLPPWLVQKIVDTAAMRSACLRDYINQKRLDLLVLARPKEMVPLHKRVCCVVCTRSFSIVRKKYNCVACGDVICNQCSVHEFVAPPSGMISDFVGKKKARICVKCSSNAKRREIPKRRASSAKPIATSGPLNEMDHRRASGSTIASSSSSSSASRASLARHQPYADQYNRFMRSASSVDTTTTSLSTDSSGSYNEENGRVHPAATTDSTGRKTIPHMFNFRPTQPSTKTTTTEARSSGRSSGLSTSHTSSSPEDEASLPQDSNGADDEVVERPERHVSDADLDFDNLLDESALDRKVGQFDPEMDAAVAEYRKTLVNGSNAHDEHDDDELTDADDDDETFASPLTSSSGSTASSATPPASTVLGDIADEDGLIIEEISPQSSFHSATGQTPRHSSVSSASDEPTVKIVKPVIIKQHVKKRFGVGGSSRSKATTINKPEVAAAPASPPRSPVGESAPHVNPLRESIVVRSRRATLVDESADADTPADEVEIQEAIQLADLQVHLDRMTMISESLRNLQKQQSLVDSPPKTAQDQAMADQLAHISNIGLRAQAEAALAAGFVQAIRDEANAKEPVATASFLDGGDNDEGEHMLGSSGDMHLVREDGSFSDYLADSSFSEISSTSPEGMAANFAPGWVAVHSMTTGKMYYYNESCGTTSWTMPTPDTNRKFGTYMVL